MGQAANGLGVNRCWQIDVLTTEGQASQGQLEIVLLVEAEDGHRPPGLPCQKHDEPCGVCQQGGTFPIGSIWLFALQDKPPVPVS